MDASELLRRVDPFLRSLASRTYAVHGWRIQSYEDLYQSLVYLALYAMELHDPSKGPLIPYVIGVVRLKLKSMLAGEYAPKSRCCPFTFLNTLVVEAGLD